MSRILVLGAAPLPFEHRRRQYASNLRTWHFTQPLVADGHRVRLIAGRLPRTYDAGVEPVLKSRDGELEYFSLEGSRFHDRGYLQELCDEFEPDAVLGVNTHPSSRAVALDTDVPMWCDLNGWVMAEAQSKCHVYEDDRYLSHFWKMEEAILDRADVISTVSRAQAFATLGELATRGRLGHRNFGYEFIHPIPNAVAEVEYRHDAHVVRDVLVPADAFVVLWAGGYNTWTDVDFLYDALTAAMEKVGRLHFVSTGGMIEGHDEITFKRFVERAGDGPYRGRFHFVGWVPTEHVPSYYFESDLGINVDSRNYETVFGARNRLNDMMKTGLAVLTTLGTEISEVIAEHELGLTSDIGDATGFAEHMIWAALHPQELRTMAERARDDVRERFSYARTTAPMRAWANAPQRAPDGGDRVEFEDIDFFRAAKSSPTNLVPATERTIATPDLERTVRQLEEIEQGYRQTRRQLDEIHGSKMWKLWMAYLTVRRWLLRPFSGGRSAPTAASVPDRPE